MSKPWLKIGVIGGLSSLVIVLGGGLVFAKQPHQDQSATQPYTKSSANNGQEKSQVLGAATNNDIPTPRSHPSQVQQKSAEVSTSTPASSSSSGTPNTSTQTDSGNIYHTHEIGILNISIQTDVGGQACGFPNGFCKWEYSANVVIKDNAGQVVASSSSANSSHTFNLPAGKYTVYAQDGDESHVAPAPVAVDINYSAPTDVTLFYEPLVMTN